jgi:hypothetical protein
MATPTSRPFVATGSGWLRGLRIYLGCIAIGNLVWESLQLPLYTIWETGTASAQAFAVIHCTLGDVLIALSALALALLLAGDEDWPAGRFRQIAVLAIVFGAAYTVFSEWQNAVVRASWAYSERMPILSLFGLRIGLAPLLQWVAVPSTAFAVAQALTARRSDAGSRPRGFIRARP